MGAAGAAAAFKGAASAFRAVVRAGAAAAFRGAAAAFKGAAGAAKAFKGAAEQPEPSREQPPGNSSTTAQLPRRQHQPGNRYMVEINSVFPDGTFGISGLIVFWVAFCCTNPKVRSLDGVACALPRGA